MVHAWWWGGGGGANNPIFSNLGLCAAHWACFMCWSQNHKLWPTSLSHPFSSLNSSLGLAGGKHYQKITILILKTCFSNFCFSRLLFLYSVLFFLHVFSLLSSGWVVIGAGDSMQLLGQSSFSRNIVNWCRVVFNGKSAEWVPWLILCFCSIIFSLTGAKPLSELMPEFC